MRLRERRDNVKNIFGAICFIGLFTEPSSMSWPCLIGWSLIVTACAVGIICASGKPKRSDSIYKLPGERDDY